MRVKDIINRVTLMYHDEDFIRMSKEQYLRLLDDSILQIILMRPDAHEKREIVKLSVGPRQRLPQGAFTLIDVYSNKQYVKDLNIYLDGKPVYQVARKDLDYFSNWYTTATNTEEINEFAYDIRTPKDYWVNPPVTMTPDVYVEIGYSCAIDNFADTNKDYAVTAEMEIGLSEEFRNALVNYMLYLCYSTDSTSQTDRTIADKYLQIFLQLIKLENDSSITATSRIIEPTTQGIGMHNDTPMGAVPVRRS